MNKTSDEHGFDDDLEDAKAGQAVADEAAARAKYVTRRQDALDMLLRKIHQTGRQSLSPKEYALLSRISKELADEQTKRAVRITRAG